MSKKFTLQSQGIEVELGKFARQADGSAWIRSGNNVVLATVCAAKEEKDFMGFFPLTVEFRERSSAAGKIPGGFFKREGKLSDAEVLISRIIDRPIRPLFPKQFFNELQIIATVHSSDGKFPSSILAIIGSSLALTISDLPFLGPVGAVQIANVKGSWKFNPTYEELEASDADLIVAGTKDGICMVEGECNNVSEAELIDLFYKAHELVVEQVNWQLSIAKELGVVKRELSSKIDFDAIEQRVQAALPKDFADQFYGDAKSERSMVMENLKEVLATEFAAELEAGTVTKPVLQFVLESLVKEILPAHIAAKKMRIDGRKFDQIRPIYSEVSTIPCSHGSSLFQRGETQALAAVTLGTGQDAQKIETLFGGLEEHSFMLHYNFPPFATGEVRPLRGVGRREIGHGFLALTSFHNVLPSQAEFPYTIRSLVDVLESNGSSSMATVCSTTLAMMDAGVPLKAMVAGVAMGLLRDTEGKLHVISDILGAEDAFGLMDLKVTGTDTGVMALQLDIKDKVGLTKELMARAFTQARAGILHILGEMRKTMTAPRKEISPFAPRVSLMKIASDKIGAVIGTGGKTIKEIVAKTGAQIDIEDDGTIKIFAKNTAVAKEAEDWIKTLVGDVEVGAVFDGKIVRYAEFGMFIELVPGRDGLIHISAIAKSKQKDIEQHHKVGDRLKVRVTAYDPDTGRIRLVAPDLE